MLAEVLDALPPVAGGLYVDATFGGGGYARAILEAAPCRVIGIDRDPAAIAAGRPLAEASDGRLRLIEGRFGALEQILMREEAVPVDGITLDLGVSSMQLDDPGRGFSFRADGPLDMRMGGPAQQAPSAADVVNGLGERDLARVIRVYGEERRSRAVAKAIVAARKAGPITRTRQLVGIVERVAGAGDRRGRIHPATRTFQALRIFVNRELEELADGLAAAERVLAAGGRLAVVSFHSLEDRIVKSFLAARSGTAPRPSRHMAPPGEEQAPAPSFRLLSRGALRPGDDEVAENPRARSARLRAAERTAAPPLPRENAPPALPRLDIAWRRAP